jgi:hypothetical protein
MNKEDRDFIQQLTKTISDLQKEVNLLKEKKEPEVKNEVIPTPGNDFIFVSVETTPLIDTSDPIVQMNDIAIKRERNKQFEFDLQVLMRKYMISHVEASFFKRFDQ